MGALRGGSALRLQSPKQQRQRWEPVHRFGHSRAPQEAIIFRAEQVVSGAI
jgi:hypothetical protein